ncbi:MAG TPA: tetratricopeptide repeat protein, partial [Casimicrobiaceae bacterium]|nr:tetratricopeptide repeat protein [Casimicrobiaceae bacterium]
MTTSLVLLALVVGLAIAWWQAIAAQRAAREAQAQAARADSMRNMVFDVLSEAEPGKPRPAETTVAEAAEHAIAALLTDSRTDPRARIELLTRFADTVGHQGHPDRAEELLIRALAEAKNLIGPADVLTSSIEEHLADYEIQRGAYQSARDRLDRLLAQVSVGASELRVRLLRASSSTAWRMRDRERALRDGNLAVTLSREVDDAELERTTLTYFANMLLSVDAVREAIAVYDQLVDLNVAKFGPNHEQVALIYTGLSRAYRRLGDLEKAEDLIRRALAIDRAIYTSDHLITATHLNSMAMIQIQRRDFAGAMESSREGLRIADNTLDDKHIDRIVYRYQVGYVLYLMERYAEALPYLRESLERMSALVGPASYRTAISRSAYGYASALAGNVETGISELDRAIVDASAQQAPDYDFVAKTIERRIRLALRIGDVETATRTLPEYASAVGKVNRADEPWWIGKVDTVRGEVLLAQKHPQDA